MDAVLGKHQTLLTSIKNKTDACTESPRHPRACELLEERFNRVQNAHNRAARSHGRLTSDDFNELNRKRRGKPPSSGATLQSFSTFATTAAAPADDVDPGIGEDLADQLDEVAGALDSANAVFQEIPAPVVTPPVHADLYDYLQDSEYPHWLHLTEGNTVAEFAVLNAWQVTNAIKEFSNRACDQVAVVAGFGGNGSFACAAIVVVVSALELTHEIMDFIGGDTDTWEIHGAYVRSGQVFENVQSLNSTLNSVAGSVGGVAGAVGDLGPQLAQHDSDIQALLQNLQATLNDHTQRLKVNYAFQRAITKLLLTQDGAKAIDAGVLACTGDDCPPVVIVCQGAQCRFPLR
jgi:hypothetical protein